MACRMINPWNIKPILFSFWELLTASLKTNGIKENQRDFGKVQKIIISSSSLSSTKKYVLEFSFSPEKNLEFVSNDLLTPFCLPSYPPPQNFFLRRNQRATQKSYCHVVKISVFPPRTVHTLTSVMPLSHLPSPEAPFLQRNYLSWEL